MKILIVAGGTGGHLYPGLAVARALTGHEILFAVRRGDLGREVLAEEGFAVQEIDGQGLPRAFSLKAFAFPVQFWRGWRQARALLKDYKPDWVLGMGGYLSVPVIITASRLGIRTLLHEQNVFPGLANRFLSRWADSVAVSFAESQTYFPKNKSWVSGLPIRSDIGKANAASAKQRLGLDAFQPVVLIFGGSLGAQRLNTCVTEAWPLLQAKKSVFQVLHVTGTKDFERVQDIYRRLNVSAKVLPYCHAMAEAYAAARVILCRAGASTVAELLTVGKPALLVPYPHASNNHQLYNARLVEKAGLGQVVLEKSLTPAGIADFLAAALTREKGAAENSYPQDAAVRIARYLVG